MEADLLTLAGMEQVSLRGSVRRLENGRLWNTLRWGLRRPALHRQTESEANGSECSRRRPRIGGEATGLLVAVVLIAGGRVISTVPRSGSVIASAVLLITAERAPSPKRSGLVSKLRGVRHAEAVVTAAMQTRVGQGTFFADISTAQSARPRKGIATPRRGLTSQLDYDDAIVIESRVTR